MKLASKRFLAGSLGLSAGVMLYLSFVDLFEESQGAFVAYGCSEVSGLFRPNILVFIMYMV